MSVAKVPKRQNQRQALLNADIDTDWLCNWCRRQNIFIKLSTYDRIQNKLLTHFFKSPRKTYNTDKLRTAPVCFHI